VLSTATIHQSNSDDDASQPYITEKAHLARTRSVSCSSVWILGICAVRESDCVPRENKNNVAYRHS
jgi:hypothetical protein